MTEPMSVVEIYPKIFVYKGFFKDIDKTYSLLKESKGEDDGLFSPWTQWSEFGEYLNPTFINQPPSMTVDYLKEMKTETEKQENQRLAILELFELFYAVTEDYALKNNVDLNKDSYVLTKEEDRTKEWKMNGPSLVRYRTDIEDPLAMTYHSDYIREPISSPGYKFTITALAYFNDNYEGGEIDFIVDGEAYMYKPGAGDFLVFPSGNSEILTKNGSVYIHGVMPANGESKYLSRMYWMKYYPGDDEWFEKEAEFGKDIWKDMQSDILKKFRKDNPNRIGAEKERRIK